MALFLFTYVVGQQQYSRVVSIPMMVFSGCQTTLYRVNFPGLLKQALFCL